MEDTYTVISLDRVWVENYNGGLAKKHKKNRTQVKQTNEHSEHNRSCDTIGHTSNRVHFW
jgi:hypothetical protein